MSAKSKAKKPKTVKIKQSFSKGANKFLEQLEKFAKQWNSKLDEVITKHNVLATRCKAIEETQEKIAKFAALEFGKIQAGHQHVTNEFAKSIDVLDLNVLTSAEILKEVFGQLQHIDELLKQDPVLATATVDLEAAKKQAETWYGEVTKAAFHRVQDMRAEHQRQREAEDLRAKEAAEKAAEEKANQEETSKAAEILRTAEAQTVHQTDGSGPGSEIPEGAEVFGG